jgi:TolB-like protein/Flp pilus assembly protein TadD
LSVESSAFNVERSAPRGAVFLSYASQDAEAVRRIAEALRAAGVEVWFDQNELVGGDAWDQKIRGQIKSCALFVPVISAATQARREGYFRLEWKLAAQRTHMISERQAFVLPVVIDRTSDAAADVPEEFRAVQWTRLPGGDGAENFCARVAKLLAFAPAPDTIADVGAAKGPESAPVPPITASRIVKRRAFLLAVSVSGAVVLGGAWMVWIWMRPQSAPSAPVPPTVTARATPAALPVATNEKSLVVLPLENLSPDPANAYFTDGVHAEIIGALVPRGDLKVISRGSALAYRGSTLKLEEIGRQLDVAFAIGGNVRRAGARVRIQLEMRRVRDDNVVWSRSYDRAADDILAIQTEIGADVARALQLRDFSGTLGGARLLTRDPEAYELFVQAREGYLKATQTPAQLIVLVDLLERSLAADPEFASAMDMLSRTYTRLAIESPVSSGRRLAYGQKSLAWAEKVAGLLPGGAGEGALAYHYNTVGLDAAAGLQHATAYLRALPKEATASHQVALALSRLDRVNEAVVMLRRARDLDPRNQWIAKNLISSLLSLRRLPEAERELTRFLALFPDSKDSALVVMDRMALGEDCPADLSAITAMNRLPLLALAGRYEELRATCAEILGPADMPGDERALPLLMLALAESRLGRVVEARRAGGELLALAQSLGVESEGASTDRERFRAWALHFLGRRNEALEVAAGLHTQIERMDAKSKLARQVQIAELYAEMRETDKCVALLTELLKSPTRLTLPALQRGATWAPVRDDARFQDLLKAPDTSKPL